MENLATYDKLLHDINANIAHLESKLRIYNSVADSFYTAIADNDEKTIERLMPCFIDAAKPL